MNTRDLSTIHTQISNLFRTKVEGFRGISPDQKENFDKNGYVSGVKLLSPEHIGALRLALDSLMDSAGDDPRFYEFNRNESMDQSKVLFHALGAWRVSEAFHDLVFYEPVASVAMKLLGGPIRFWHDQLFVKPAHHGGVVAWHQDYAYWTRTKPLEHITCWIALDDSTVENGCLHYVPGSHKWQLLPKTDLADDMGSVIRLLDEDQRSKFKPIPIELKAGEASFHHAMTLHGSYENRSERPRRAVVINMFRDGVASDSDQPLLKGIPVITKGEKIDGQFFPLISSLS